MSWSDIRGRAGRGAKLAAIVALAVAAGWLLRSLTAPAPVTQAPPSGVQAGEAEAQTIWTCSMHPQIRRDRPGQCPICFMDLIPVSTGSGGEEAPRRLRISPAARALIDVRTVPVERRAVAVEVPMVGRIAHDETRLAYITAWVGGRIERLYVDSTGIPVQAGEHLVQLYSPELYAAQEELLQAAAAARQLQDPGALVRRGLTETLEATRERLRLWGLTPRQIEALETSGEASPTVTINSPISGVVIHKNAQQGMYVETGTRIYTLADLERLWVNLEAYESDLAWLRYGQEVAFTTEALPGRAFEGTIALIDPELDPRTRTVRVRLNVENPERLLKPGMFVRARASAQVASGGRVMAPELAGKWICPMHPEVVREEPADCPICGMDLVTTESLGYVAAAPGEAQLPLVIPASAPLITGRRAIVYVELPDEDGPTFEGREVVLGPRAGESYLVESGLLEGERVVVEGNFKLDSALQIRARPSMMLPPEEGAAVPAPPPPRSAAAHAQHAASVAAEHAPPAFRAQLGAVWRVYLVLQQALAADDPAAARAALPELRRATAAVDAGALHAPAAEAWAPLAREWSAALDALEAAEELEPLRVAFEPVSAALARILGTFGLDEGPVYELECPMAFGSRAARWLQPDERVLNPYRGASMLRCGTVEAQLVSESGAPEMDDGR